MGKKKDDGFCGHPENAEALRKVLNKATGHYSGDTVTLADHSACIPRASLPGLPEGWIGPFKTETCDSPMGISPRYRVNGWCLCGDGEYRENLYVMSYSEPHAVHIAALLNAVYPQPPQPQKEGV